MPAPATEMDWGDYAPIDAGVTGALRDASREDAEALYARLMTSRAERVAALAALAARHGVSLEPVPLGGWLLERLRATGPAAIAHPMWTGVIADVALWLGERCIATSGTLRWELYTAHKKATGYQRAVLMGFSKVTDPRYYVDVAFMVASWADLAARGRQAKPDFLATIEQVTLKDA